MREIVEMDPTWTYKFFQSFYIMPERQGLYPNRTFVQKSADGIKVLFETNSWGLRGPEPDGSKPVAVVWGDSVVFGFSGRSWIDGANDLQDKYLVLNGGIEGDGPVNILRRMWDTNRDHKIDVNIFFPGWHDRPGYAYDPPSEWMPQPSLNDLLPKVIAEKKSFGRLVLCTLPSWLFGDLLEQDVPSHFKITGNVLEGGHFAFWGDLKYSKDLALRIRRYAEERNTFLRQMAAQHDLGLIDLEKHFHCPSMKEATEYFFDICHFRPSMYDRLSAVLHAELQRILEGA